MSKFIVFVCIHIYFNDIYRKCYELRFLKGVQRQHALLEFSDLLCTAFRITDYIKLSKIKQIQRLLVFELLLNLPCNTARVIPWGAQERLYRGHYIRINTTLTTRQLVQTSHRTGLLIQG